MRASFILAFLLTVVGYAAQGQVLQSDKPWTRHCNLTGIIVPVSTGERQYLVGLANACEPQGACILACTRSGCATGIAGGCDHACSRGLPQDLAVRAEAWATGPTCPASPDNSFKPKPVSSVQREFLSWYNGWHVHSVWGAGILRAPFAEASVACGTISVPIRVVFDTHSSGGVPPTADETKLKVENHNLALLKELCAAGLRCSFDEVPKP